MRKYILIGLGTIILFLCMLGASYALWTLNLVQKEENYLATTCFDVTFLEDSTSTILLPNAYPLLDSEGSALTPYVFTVKNNCDAYAKYELSLEVNRNSTLNSEYLKVMVGNQTPSLLSSYPLGEPTDSLYSSSYILETGYLNVQESKEYQFRVWLDENVTLEMEGVQNSRWSGRITVTASYAENFGTNAVEYITNLASVDTNLAYDNTSDNNLRYIGSTPSNYVTFHESYQTDIYDIRRMTGSFFGFSFSSLEECNTLKLEYGYEEGIECEKTHSKGDPILWRAIGVMNNIDDGSGNLESRVKLIRNDSIGPWAWDSSPSTINGGRGVNEWSQADVKTILNDYYYNRVSSAMCSHDTGEESVPCDFSKIGFLEDAKKFIAPALWHTGSGGEGTDSFDANTSKYYELERSSNTGKVCPAGGGDLCNDEVERKTTWIGLIGLPYPSDYGFSMSGTESTDRATCLDLPLIDAGANTSCMTDIWLVDFNGSHIGDQWTMTPHSYPDEAGYVTTIFDGGILSKDWADYGFYSGDGTGYIVRPTVYLKSDVKIIRGDGSINHPYEFGL